MNSNQFHTPARMIPADDKMTADEAYRLVCEGTGLLWQGDFQNAKQLLQAIDRRWQASKKKKKAPENKTGENVESTAQIFHTHRQAQAHRARILSMILIPIEKDFSIPLRRAPDAATAIKEAIGPLSENIILPLRQLLGFIGAHEWQKKGVFIPELDKTIHPLHGVYSPIRGEYLKLIAQAPLPTTELAFDIGTGTGVIASLLAKRGVKKIIATEIDPQAVRCAEENIKHLGYSEKIQVQQVDLFPPGLRAPLIVCNPPWIPVRPTSVIENALYDFESKMLKNFLSKLNEHLTENGEAWLIMSDLAERLGLRESNELNNLILSKKLTIIEQLRTKPIHRKSHDTSDPLYFARSEEITSLYRIKFSKTLN